MNAALRLSAWLLAIALVALPLVAVLQGWIAADRWPLRRLVVSAPFVQVSDEAVRAAVAGPAARGFFAVRLDEVREAVAALPWVQSVEVRKRWPDRLELVVTEHTAVARWGERHLLSATGVLIDLPPEAARPAGLPLLLGPDERSDEVVALYDQAQPLFVALGERVGQVELSPRGSWRVVLESGVELVVGRDDALPRLARFARLMPALVIDEPRRLARADLRYTNGFALAWQSAEAAHEQQGTH